MSVSEADVRYNTTDYALTDSPGSGCSGKYDIRAIGTHEAGHVFGLSDLYARSNGNLTMYGYSDTCSSATRTLGKGDIFCRRTLH